MKQLLNEATAKGKKMDYDPRDGHLKKMPLSGSLRLNVINRTIGQFNIKGLIRHLYSLAELFSKPHTIGCLQVKMKPATSRHFRTHLN